MYSSTTIIYKNMLLWLLFFFCINNYISNLLLNLNFIIEKVLRFEILLIIIICIEEEEVIFNNNNKGLKNLI